MDTKDCEIVVKSAQARENISSGISSTSRTFYLFVTVVHESLLQATVMLAGKSTEGNHLD
jgi:hypothetical protein